MDMHRFREPLLWCTSPEQVHLLDAIPHQGLVYDCAQDWLDTPPEWESDLALAADVIFAASEGLVDHLSPCSDNIALLPNGVSYPMFSRPDNECPAPLADLTGPILGFVGTIWEDLDLTPAIQAARALPRCTFVFVGQVEPYNPQLRTLEVLPNVRLMGRQLPVDIPDYLSRFDVCLHLLRQSDYGADIVPSRVYEYLTSGKPIVAMFYPDHVEHFPDVIYAAHSPASLCGCASVLWKNRMVGLPSAGGNMGLPPPGPTVPCRLPRSSLPTDSTDPQCGRSHGPPAFPAIADKEACYDSLFHRDFRSGRHPAGYPSGSGRQYQLCFGPPQTARPLFG